MGKTISSANPAQENKTNSRLDLSSLSSLTQQIPDALFALDDEGRILSANSPAQKLFGYPASELIGNEFSQFARDGQKLQLQQALAGLVLQGDSWAATIPILRKNGSLFYCDTSISLLLDTGAKPLVIHAFCRDVTHQRSSLLELRESRRKLSILMDNLPGMAYRCLNDEQWTMEFVSRGCEKLTGYSSRQIIGNRDISYAELIAPEDRESVWKSVQEALSQNRSFRIEYRIRSKDGHVKSVWEHGVAVKSPDGETEVLEGFIIDVTERARAQTALEESESRIRAILDSTSKVFMLLDSDGRISAFNQRATDFVRTVCDMELSQDTFIYDLLNPKTASETRRLLAESLNGRPSRVQREYVRDGHDFTLEIDFTPVMDDDDSVVGVCFGATDITDKLRMEHHQKALEERLRHSQKLESLGVLAGGIAHDFNNLLMGILGNAELALMDAGEQAELRECLIDIVSAARRAGELTDKLLAYSGKGIMAIKPTDLSDLIIDMTDLIESTLPPNVNIHYDLGDRLPTVGADQNQLRQSILSIITNAAESLFERGGDITIETRVVELTEYNSAGLISEDAVPSGDYIAIEISDNGCGMDEDTMSKAFEPFFSTKFTGRGLGLAAVLGIVRRHKGAIRLKSRLGEGTEFTLLIPVSNDIHAEDSRQTISDNTRSSARTILVVDDERNSRDVAVAVLKRSGYDVLVAGNGEETLHILRTENSRIAALMLDIMLPDIRGDALLREVRRIDPTMPVLFSSGYNEDMVTDILDEVNGVSFIQKPYSPADLQMCFDKLISVTEMA